MARRRLLKARLNLKIDIDLKEWAMDYARRNNTDVTRMITDHFRNLREIEQSELHEDVVDQI